MIKVWRNKQVNAIDLDEQEIKIATLTQKGRCLDCRVAAFPGFGSDLSETAAVADALKAAADSAGIAGSKVISAVNGSKVILKQLKIPKIPKQEIAGAVRWEAEKLLMTPLEELELRHVILGETVEDDLSLYHVLLAAVPKETVYTYYEVFARANLKLVALDLPALALWRVFARGNCSPRYSESVAVLQIGFANSQLIVINNRHLSYLHVLSVGAGNIVQSLSTSATGTGAADFMNHSGMQDLIAAIKGALDSYQLQNKEGRLQNLVLIGSLNELPAVTGLFEQALGISTAIGYPVLPLGRKRQAITYSSAFTVAIGLALREVLR